ncbi:MAG: shikimate kinase [Candidatus Nanopelagicales bacterium]|nr:shikimate kinase [Candidatus Nanopelagicales bacterium]
MSNTDHIDRPVCVIVGVPGSGKSSLGRRVANRLKVCFADTDQLIEKSVGMSVPDIFITMGEAEFRRIEEEVVACALRDERGVVSLGGGAVMNPNTSALLAEQVVVWLRVSLSDAANRVGMNTARPLLLGNVRGQLKSLMDERSSTYEAVSTFVVDTSGKSLKVLTDELAGLVQGAANA